MITDAVRADSQWFCNLNSYFSGLLKNTSLNTDLKVNSLLGMWMVSLGCEKMKESPGSLVGTGFGLIVCSNKSEIRVVEDDLL